MTHDPTYEAIKADVLSGMSGYAAAKKRGVDSLKYARRLSDDPDIVAAKASGQIRSLARRTKTLAGVDYMAKPHVIDVIENGLTQSEAAKKHGISQPLVGRHVKLALGGESLESFRGKRKTSAVPPSPDAALIAEMAKSLSSKSDKSAKALLEAALALV